MPWELPHNPPFKQKTPTGFLAEKEEKKADSICTQMCVPNGSYLNVLGGKKIRAEPPNVVVFVFNE